MGRLVGPPQGGGPDRGTRPLTRLSPGERTRPGTIDFEYTGSAEDPFGNDRIGFEGATVINRKEWGLTWNANLDTGGVLVSQKVTLEIDVAAVKQQ